MVCASTRGDYGTGDWSVSTPKLVGGHCYEVVAVNAQTRRVTLRNPWGVDGGTGSGDRDDGIVTVTFQQFRGSFATVGIS